MMLAILLVNMLAFTPALAMAAAEPKASAQTPSPSMNSSSYVDVTRGDGLFVKQPLVSSIGYDAKIAAQNTVRMKAIMSSSAIGEYCRVHFPAGSYYFNGAAPGWAASIQSTAKNQSFTGDGIKATRIIQKSLTVPVTIKIHHSNCTLENLSIMSSDYSPTYNEEWESHPLQTAIALEAPTPWYTDPQILNVNINATGNNIVVDGYYRPFTTGIKLSGPWLNVYVHTMFIQHVHTSIYIDQGIYCGGPAKFIDVNAYATAPNSEGAKPKAWNTFFKSEGNFMEQVELIHCTYIGSQFIYMDGTELAPGGDSANKPSTTPVYNMIVDHCYINSLWLPSPSDDPKWSGIYMNLPPRPGGIVKEFGSQLYSRRILFTNNTCLGKTPGKGAFFYVEGNVRDLTIEGNSMESGGGIRGIYIRATTPFLNTDIGVRDVTITNNMIQDFAYPIVIGGTDDTAFVEGVTINDNRTTCLTVIEHNQVTGITLNRVRRVGINSNRFAKTDGSAVVMNECEDITMNANSFTGFAELGKNGIALSKCRTASLTGNILRAFKQGVGLEECDDIVLSSNNLVKCPVGMSLKSSRGLIVTGNLISGSSQSINIDALTDATVSLNTIRSGEAVSVTGKNVGLDVQSNVGAKPNP